MRALHTPSRSTSAVPRAASSGDASFRVSFRPTSCCASCRGARRPGRCDDYANTIFHICMLLSRTSRTPRRRRQCSRQEAGVGRTLRSAWAQRLPQADSSPLFRRVCIVICSAWARCRCAAANTYGSLESGIQEGTCGPVTHVSAAAHACAARCSHEALLSLTRSARAGLVPRPRSVRLLPRPRPQPGRSPRRWGAQPCNWIEVLLRQWAPSAASCPPTPPSERIRRLSGARTPCTVIRSAAERRRRQRCEATRLTKTGVCSSRVACDGGRAQEPSRLSALMRLRWSTDRLTLNLWARIAFDTAQRRGGAHTPANTCCCDRFVT